MIFLHLLYLDESRKPKLQVAIFLSLKLLLKIEQYNFNLVLSQLIMPLAMRLVFESLSPLGQIVNKGAQLQRFPRCN